MSEISKLRNFKILFSLAKYTPRERTKRDVTAFFKLIATFRISLLILSYTSNPSAQWIWVQFAFWWNLKRVFLSASTSRILCLLTNQQRQRGTTATFSLGQIILVATAAEIPPVWHRAHRAVQQTISMQLRSFLYFRYANLKPKRDNADKNVLGCFVTFIFIALYEYCIESPSIQFTHRNYTIIYRFTMAVSTHYNLQKSTLQKFKNPKYQKGTVEENRYKFGSQ